MFGEQPGLVNDLTHPLKKKTDSSIKIWEANVQLQTWASFFKDVYKKSIDIANAFEDDEGIDLEIHQ